MKKFGCCVCFVYLYVTIIRQDFQYTHSIKLPRKFLMFCLILTKKDLYKARELNRLIDRKREICYNTRVKV